MPKLARYTVVAVSLVVGLLGCGDDKLTRDKPSTNPDQRPRGGSAPPELQGRWQLVAVSQKTIKIRFPLTITDRQYRLMVGVVGRIVATGNEIDFYNENLCGLAFPEGVGRYRWNV